MKKILVIVLCLLVAFTSVACASEDGKAAGKKAEEKTTEAAREDKVADMSAEAASEEKTEAADATEADAKEKARDKVVITVGAPGSFYPVAFLENGELQGFEHAIWTEIGKRCDFEIKWEVSDDYSVLFGNLESSRIDTIAGQITITDKRKEMYNFTEPYGFQQIKMVVRADDEAESLGDLHGRKICIEYGTVLADFLMSIMRNYLKQKKLRRLLLKEALLKNCKWGASMLSP